MTELMRRRRALMAQKSEPQGNRVDHIDVYGSTVVTLNSDQTITMTAWQGQWSGRFRIYWKDTITTVAGDTIKIRLTKISGTAPHGTAYLALYPNELTLISNKYFDTNFIDKDITKTITADRENDSLNFNCTSTMTISEPLVFRLSIWVNNVLVLGEG